MARPPRRPRRTWAALAAAVVLLGAATALVVVATTDDDEHGSFDYDHPFDSSSGVAEAGTATEAGSAGAPGFDDPSIREFLPFVAQEVQGFWEQEFQRAGLTYEQAPVVIFRGSRETPCGTASRATGPLYCPRDRRIYLELGFFDALAREFHAPGDLAFSFVVAHAIAHHVQNLGGITGQVERARRQGRGTAGELSARIELQADCLAGVWAHSTYERGLLEGGVVDEGLRAVAATWRHGSPAQRRKWFVRGFESGDPAACDTFSPP